MHQVLLRPVVSEKSTNAAEANRQVVFEVLENATKAEVREAVEKLFDVSVTAVQVLNVRGKIKRFGKTPGKRNNWKKAYVRLAAGDDIDFLGSGA
jgi:large subunit ribosomal protein L23